jgi:hypothetical protein
VDDFSSSPEARSRSRRDISSSKNSTARAVGTSFSWIAPELLDQFATSTLPLPEAAMPAPMGFHKWLNDTPF